jgi:mono/diheme cytochrome c family protein
VSVDRRTRVHPGTLLPLVFLAACSWFTDFKQQPKIDPWESPADSIPPRGNPQGSIPISGSAAPEMMYARTMDLAVINAMGAIANPVAPDSASASRGRILFQINCAVCHGAMGQGIGPIAKFASIAAAPPLGATSPSAGYPDGKIFAIIRNGIARMSS